VYFSAISTSILSPFQTSNIFLFYENPPHEVGLPPWRAGGKGRKAREENKVLTIVYRHGK